jgi:hypothetical protein
MSASHTTVSLEDREEELGYLPVCPQLFVVVQKDVDEATRRRKRSDGRTTCTIILSRWEGDLGLGNMKGHGYEQEEMGGKRCEE